MSSTVNRLLHGVLPVLHTPFTDRGAIDGTSLQREIDWAFEIGADGVVVAMVSESCGWATMAEESLPLWCAGAFRLVASPSSVWERRALSKRWNLQSTRKILEPAP